MIYRIINNLQRQLTSQQYYVKAFMKSAVKRLRYCNLFRYLCVYSHRKNQVGYPAWKLKKRNFIAWRYEYDELEPILLVLPTRALPGDFWIRAGERRRNHNWGE